MKFTANTLTSFQDPAEFKRAFIFYATEAMHVAQLHPQFSHLRIDDAWGAWNHDLQRVGEREKKLSDGMDHFKQAGHLAFWIRRMGPVTEAMDLLADMPPEEAEKKLGGVGADYREFLFAYCNEYLAFDFGFNLCRFYELAQEPASDRAKELRLGEDYLRLACNFMKYKTVSPHAMMLVYKSLLLSDGAYKGPVMMPGAV